MPYAARSLVLAAVLLAAAAGPPAVAGSVPSATNVDHIGLTVPALDAAPRFVVDVLGAQRAFTFEAGPGTSNPKSISQRFGVPPGAHLKGAFFRFGPTLNLELLQYTATPQRQGAPVVSDQYAAHIALFVTDMAAASRYLEAHGCRLLPGPETAKDGPNKGQTNRYTRSDIGLIIELINRPSEQPFQATTSTRLYGPAAGWTSPGP